MTPRKLYRIVAVAETITWALLIGALIARYGFGVDELVFPAGLTHGFVFVAYSATALIVGLNQRWPWREIVLAVLTAVIPFVTIPFDVRLERRGRLVGHWRREATDDPRDRALLDRLLRWFLRRPWLLVAVAAVGIVAVVVVLLMLGPPTEWGR